MVKHFKTTLRLSMKKIIYSFFLMSFAVISHADNFYFEGNIGRYDLDTVNTNTYSNSFTANGVTFGSSFSGDLDYDEDYALGFELGMKINENVRLGISYTDLDLSFEGANLSASVTDGTTTVNASARLTAADANALGLNWDNDADVYMLNAYYDFNNVHAKYIPFVGVGIGQADISNANDDETALSLAAGVNMDLENNMYAGLKLMLTQIDGPTDGLGITYEDIDVTSLHFMIGYKF
jgi:hypothetical protein